MLSFFMLISPKCESRKALDLLTIQVATTTECFSYFAWKLVGCSFLSETLPLSFFHIKTEVAQQQYHLQSSFTMQKCTHYSTTSFKWHFPSSLKILSMVFESKGYYIGTTCHCDIVISVPVCSSLKIFGPFFGWWEVLFYVRLST